MNKPFLQAFPTLALDASAKDIFKDVVIDKMSMIMTEKKRTLPRLLSRSREAAQQER